MCYLKPNAEKVCSSMCVCICPKIDNTEYIALQILKWRDPLRKEGTPKKNKADFHIEAETSELNMSAKYSHPLWFAFII